MTYEHFKNLYKNIWKFGVLAMTLTETAKPTLQWRLLHKWKKIPSVLKTELIYYTPEVTLLPALTIQNFYKKKES